MRYTHATNKPRPSGFTLVELLVISPLLIILVAVLIGFFVALTGDALVSRERNTMVYGLQNALAEVENDIRFSNSIVYQTGPLPLGQGSDNNFSGESQFTSNADVLILELNATDKSPLDPSRKLLYYSNSPQPCSNPEFNDTVKHRVIYFLDGTNLTKRSIVNFNGQTVCGVSSPNSSGIYQRNSCKTTNDSTCFTRDTVLAGDISDIDFKYFLTRTSQTPTTPTASTELSSVEVTIVGQKQSAGSTISQSVSLRAAKIN